MTWGAGNCTRGVSAPGVSNLENLNPSGYPHVPSSQCDFYEETLGTFAKKPQLCKIHYFMIQRFNIKVVIK